MSITLNRNIPLFKLFKGLIVFDYINNNKNSKPSKKKRGLDNYVLSST